MAAFVNIPAGFKKPISGSAGLAYRGGYGADVTPSMPRRACAGAALLLVLLSASGMRHVIPGLREATRAIPAKAGHATPARLGSARAEVRAEAGPPPPASVAHAAPAPTRYKFPRPVSQSAPRAREPGADAHFGTLPRSARWAVLGGHGRNGAG